MKWAFESNQIYTNINIPIKWCFGYDDNPKITAVVNRKTNTISVNILFVDEAYTYNRIYEIEYFLLHEMGHIYQHLQIEKYKNKGITVVDPKYVELWTKEGNDYIKSLDKDGNENIEYFKQDCELDAYAFSFAVMHLKYKGIYDSKLLIPEIYKKELKEEFASAVNEFLNNI